MLSQKRLTRRRFLSFLPTVPMAILGNKQPQKTSFLNPKFNIGDYVECLFPDAEDSSWYERGEIIGIARDMDGNWDYRFVIRECPHSDWLGLVGEAFEENLILLALAN